MPDNKLYYGDNLDVLRLYVKDESMTLCTSIRHSKSQQDYNVLFAEKDGTRTRYGCEFKTQTIQNILERVTE